MLQVIKEAATKGSTQQRKPRQAPVNDQQAAAGKIDYVKVITQRGCPSLNTQHWHAVQISF